MGKYMKKRRVLGEKLPAMEVSKSQLGVRTRAMERKKNLGNEHHTTCIGSCDVRKSDDPQPTHSAPTMQVSYLELRNRRLEKVMGCSGASTRVPNIHKSTVASEYRRLSHLANSDAIVDDSLKWAQSESRLTYSDDVHFSMQLCNFNLGQCLSSDENTCRDPLNASLRTSIKHLLTGGNNHRGRNAPPVALSQSNSRSNSITCERSPGILTRNQRRQQTQSDCMDVESSSGRNENTTHNSGRNGEFDASCGESPVPEVCSGKDRIIRESTCRSYGREAAATTSVLCDLQCCTTSHVFMSAMDMEIEEFFIQSETREQRRFIEKYNFDPVEETPLPGRFAWVSLQCSM